MKRFTPPKAKEYIKYGKWLAEPREAKFFEGNRIYSRKILGERLVVTFTDDNSVADQQVYITLPKLIGIDAKIFAAILGSKAISYYIRNYYDEVNDAFPQIKISQLKSLPIPELDKNDNKLEEIKSKICSLVTQLIDSKKQFEFVKTDRDRTFLENKCTALDRQIDNVVYQLYELTPEEIAIIEKG